MTDLYRVLKVKRSATPEQIRQAFRALALKHHPDRGGDRAKFEAAQLAFDVLSDPQRRARYDATGEYVRRAEGNPDAPAVEALGMVLSAVLQALADAGRSPEREDVLAHLRKGLGNAREQVRQQLDQADAEEAKFKRAQELLEQHTYAFTPPQRWGGASTSSASTMPGWTFKPFLG